MGKQIVRTKEGVDLLQNLLNILQKKDHKIALNLHNKKTILSAVGLKLALLAKDNTKRKKINSQDLLDLKSILDGIVEEIRPIHKEIFASNVFMFGLLGPLHQVVSDYQENFGVEIIINYDDITSLPGDRYSQVHLYEVCMLIIENLRLLGYRKIAISLALKNNVLNVRIVGVRNNSLKNNQMHLIANEKIIKAYLVWKNVRIDGFTDWNSIFSLYFTL